MSTSKPIFEDREKGYEQGLVHNQDLAFRAHALRNRLLAEWAAARMRLVCAAAEGYIAPFFEGEGFRTDDAHLVRKLVNDTQLSSEPISEYEADLRIRHFAGQAHAIVHEAGR